MTSLRSSVNPGSTKQPWGTILKPNFGLGYQKMNGYEVEQTVERLAARPNKKERVYERAKQADLNADGIEQMVSADVLLVLIILAKRVPQLKFLSITELNRPISLRTCHTSLSRCLTSPSRCLASLSHCVTSLSSCVTSLLRCLTSLSRCLTSPSRCLTSLTRDLTALSRFR